MGFMDHLFGNAQPWLQRVDLKRTQKKRENRIESGDMVEKNSPTIVIWRGVSSLYADNNEHFCNSVHQVGNNEYVRSVF